MRLDDLARRSAKQARAAADATSAPDVTAYRATKRRRAALGASGVMALLAVAVVGSLMFAGGGEDTVAVTTTVVQPTTTMSTDAPSLPVTEPGEPSSPLSILGAGWEELDPGPIAGRHRVAAAWTGTELFVWGGDTVQWYDAPDDLSLHRQDGYLFNPRTGLWREVAPLPDTVCQPLGEAVATAAGDTIVLRGRVSGTTECARAAAYQPATDTWEPLHSDVFRGHGVALVWTGDLLVAPTISVAYDWSSGRTIDLPAFPAGQDDAVHSPQRAHWTGDRVLVIGSGGVREWVPGADQWLLLDGPPVPDRARHSVWTDQGLLVVNYQMAAAFYRDGEWSRPGDLPLRFFECLPEAISVGGTPVVRMCSGIAIWDEVRRSWVPVARDDVGNPSWGPLVASDDSLYVMGPNFRRFTIERNQDGSIVVPPTIPIGVMQLDIPDGFDLVSSFAPEQDPAGFIPDDETIGVVFESRLGTRCTVTSTYGPGEDWPAGFTEGREGVQVWGRPVTEYIDADGTVGMALHDSNGSDVVFAWCVGPSVADYLPAIDFIAGLWSPWEEPRVEMADAFEPRAGHEAIWTGSELLIYGGSGGVTGLGFDPLNGTWRELAPSPGGIEPWWAGRAVWAGDRMVVAGRRPYVEGTVQDALLLSYFPASDSWEVSPPLPERRLAIGAMVWTGEEIIFAGGDHLYPDASAWAYTPSTGDWRPLPDPGIPEVEGLEGVWTGSAAIFVGGYAFLSPTPVVAYDPASDSWRQLAPFPLQFVQFHRVAWTGTRVIVYSGHAGPDHPAGVFLYDPATDEWTTSAPMPISPRERLAGDWTGSRLVIWGGYDTYGQQRPSEFADGAIYDPVSDVWTVMAASPLAARCDHSGTWVVDVFVVFGGLRGCGSDQELLEDIAAAYDPVTDRWRVLPPDGG